MGRGPSQRGIEARQKILAELARRWENMEDLPGWKDLEAVTGLKAATIAYHLRALRQSGYIHQEHLQITKSGYSQVKPDS